MANSLFWPWSFFLLSIFGRRKRTKIAKEAEKMSESNTDLASLSKVATQKGYSVMEKNRQNAKITHIINSVAVAFPSARKLMAQTSSRPINSSSVTRREVSGALSRPKSEVWWLKSEIGPEQRKKSKSASDDIFAGSIGQYVLFSDQFLFSCQIIIPLACNWTGNNDVESG